MDQEALLWHERQSASPFVESIWASSTHKPAFRSVIADPCICVALVKSKKHTEIIISGPKTKPYLQSIPANNTCTTIRLKPGVFLKNFRSRDLIDNAITIPTDAEANFWLGGALFQFPDFDQAEQLIEKLYAAGCLGFKPLQYAYDRPRRTFSRHMRQLTGLSPYKLYQLERMHQALRLLKKGVVTADVATELAFTDQAHFIHASKKFFGYTPSKVSQLLQNP